MVDTKTMRHEIWDIYEAARAEVDRLLEEK